jgi:multimeric flavodoxin WrbA
MQALAISGSPRKKSNTEFLLRRCLDSLGAQGIPGELMSLRDKTIKGCRACDACRRNKDKRCSTRDDDFQPIFDAIVAAPEMMALLDRAGYVSRANDGLLSRKLGGPIAVARRAGHNFTYAQLLFWFMINDMVVPGSSYWNVALAREPEAVAEDKEALGTIDRFAENLAWLARRTIG